MVTFQGIGVLEIINNLTLTSLDLEPSTKVRFRTPTLIPYILFLITVFEVKFMSTLSFLITIRVGTPRYRYDFLSKLG